jgi:nucleoside-diphosphate-sugar epimerase
VTGERVLVLGASGFIGARLIRRLVAGGSAPIALDIRPPAVRLPGVDYLEHDIRQPIPQACGKGVDVLYNLAAVHRTPGHPDGAYYETNIAGAVNAAALAAACDIRTLLFSSSISVYGPSEALLTEASPPNPISAYGRSKYLAEQIHRQWLEASPGRRLIIVRPGVIFGPGEGGNYTQLARALRGGYFAYPGRRDTIKSGGYVDELLDTMAFALARPERSVLYNFAYSDLSTTEDIVRAFAGVAGYGERRPTLPLPILMLAAKLFKFGDALGLKSWIHPDRVMKLVQSTRVAPAWLESAGYRFHTRLETALELWRNETDGRFD